MSNPYSAKSQAKLDSADERLQQVFKEAARWWNVTIIEGHRSTRRQRQLYMAGKSKLDGVTKRSNHNHEPSRAVDAAPYPIDWQDTDRFYRFGFYVLGLAAAMGVKLRWGGDWDSDGDTTDQTFNDLVHFEVVDE
jgi:hypothetical protein